MRLPHEAHRSSVYLNFKEIDAMEYRSIVRFYEEYKNDIQLLTLEEYFEMSLAYVSALFEVGAYNSYLDSCDDAIESVIYFNIAEYEGEDIYHKLLFRKAVSLYHLMEYQQSEKIFRELIRMNPKEKKVVRFLKKCLIEQPPKVVRRTRSVSVLFFLITAGVIAIEVLFIKILFPEYGQGTEYLRNAIFIIGWLILASGGLYLRVSAFRKVSQYLKEIKN